MKKQPTERERKESHRVKMEMKEAKRKRIADSLPKPFIFANISKNHEFYGDTPTEHAERKNQQKSS